VFRHWGVSRNFYFSLLRASSEWGTLNLPNYSLPRATLPHIFVAILSAISQTCLASSHLMNCPSITDWLLTASEELLNQRCCIWTHWELVTSFTESSILWPSNTSLYNIMIFSEKLIYHDCSCLSPGYRHNAMKSESCMCNHIIQCFTIRWPVNSEKWSENQNQKKCK
jgi:hypothetical protein